MVAYEQMDRRLNNIDQDLGKLRGELNTRLYWLLGTILGMWVSLMLTILFR